MKQKFDKHLYITRHAHRDTSDRELDNGLTEKGHQQAKALGSYLEKVLKAEKGVHLESSPRQRCQETLAPLAQSLGQKLKINSQIDETGRNETRADVRNRIQKFTSDWKSKGPEHLVICSHGDIIPELTDLLLQSSIELNKGGLLEIKLAGKEVILFETRQSFL